MTKKPKLLYEVTIRCGLSKELFVYNVESTTARAALSAGLKIFRREAAVEKVTSRLIREIT